MKKFLAASFLALIALAPSVNAFDLGFKASRTPYDPYMSPVRHVLSSVEGEEDSLRDVTKLMRIGRSFRYSFNRPYTAMPPSITERNRSGDCKDKALWLLSRINDSSARFVIGRASSRSKISHAWVMWQNEGRWWILDCTNTSRPIPADRVGSSRYIPLYSYSKSGVYVHGANQIASSSSSRGREPVASWSSKR